MSKRQIQIVAFSNPYPPNYGGAIDMYYKIKALHKLGIDIILHFFYKDRVDISGLEDYCSIIYKYKQQIGLSSHFSLKPFSSLSRRNKTLFDRLTKSNAPILIESLRCCEVLNFENLPQKTAVRTHNIEHLYSKGLSQSSKDVVHKIAHSVEAYKQKHYEKILNKADFLFNISNFEHRYFEENYDATSIFLPVFTGFEAIKSVNGFGKYALYHGDLASADNVKSALFLIKVFKDLSFELVIASNTKNKVVLDTISEYKNIRFEELNSTEHLHSLIKNAHINTLYSFQKSGTKLKVFNALFNGRHCIINTNIVDDEAIVASCYLAKSKKDYKEKVENLINTEFELDQKRKEALTKYNDVKNAEIIVSALF